MIGRLAEIIRISTKKQVNNNYSNLEETIGIISDLTSQIINGRHLHPVMQIVDPDFKIMDGTKVNIFESPQHKARTLMSFMSKYLEGNPDCREDEFILSVQKESTRLKTGKIFSQCFELRLGLFFAVDYIRFGRKTRLNKTRFEESKNPG